MSTTRKVLALVVVNLLVLFMGLLGLELVFGHWFRPDPMAELRVLRNYEARYDASQLYPTKEQVHYKRDANGFRGSYPSVDKIDVLTLGGSTTDQKFITEGQTWQDVMARETGLAVVNAGVDGQSSYGHVRAFQSWFSHLPGLKVRYFLFYVGYNDLFIEPGWNVDRVRGDTWSEQLKSRSALVGLVNTLSGWARARQTQIGHGACRLEPADCASEPLLKDHKQLFAKRLAAYRANLEQLATDSRKLGATPVFVTQTCRWYKLQDGKLIGNRQTLKIDGHELNGLDVYYLLDALNDEARGMKDAIVVDVARDLDFGDDDFYDLAHNTPPGAEKLGKFIGGRLPR